MYNGSDNTPYGQAIGDAAQSKLLGLFVDTVGKVVE